MNWVLILFFIFIYLFIFIFGCVGSSLLHLGFLQLQRVGATLRCGARASPYGGFSCCAVWALGMRASVVVAHELSSCGAWAQLLRGMWDLPGPGLKPMSPALAGRFLSTAPPGKSLVFYFKALIKFLQLSFCFDQRLLRKDARTKAITGSTWMLCCV